MVSTGSQPLFSEIKLARQKLQFLRSGLSKFELTEHKIPLLKKKPTSIRCWKKWKKVLTVTKVGYFDLKNKSFCLYEKMNVKFSFIQ